MAYHLLVLKLGKQRENIWSSYLDDKDAIVIKCMMKTNMNYMQWFAWSCNGVQRAFTTI